MEKAGRGSPGRLIVVAGGYKLRNLWKVVAILYSSVGKKRVSCLHNCLKRNVICNRSNRQEVIIDLYCNMSHSLFRREILTDLFSFSQLFRSLNYCYPLTWPANGIPQTMVVHVLGFECVRVSVKIETEQGGGGGGGRLSVRDLFAVGVRL